MLLVAGLLSACTVGARGGPPPAADDPLTELGARFEVAPRPELPAAPTLADYLGFALSNSYEIHRAMRSWAAARERIPQRTALPDPRLGVTEQLESVETRVGPQQRAFSLSQTIPWFGKLSLRGRIEERETAAAWSRLEAAVLEVFQRVQASYADLAYLGRAISITGDHLRLMTRWEEAARSRYATGVGGYADVIKAQVELARLSDRQAELEDRRRRLGAALAAALGLRDASDLPLPDRLPEIATPLYEEKLRALLRERNPELAALAHRIEASREAEELAGKEGYPDLTLGLGYIQTGEAAMAGVTDSGKDPLTVSLSINVPIWRGKYAAARREAAEGRLALRAERQDRELALDAALASALFGYRDALRKQNLYGSTLLPKGRQSLAAAQAAYETGAAGFLDLVDAERVLLEFELAHARARADLVARRAEIEKLVAATPSAAQDG
jgi:cobalt-zinc-cadmium efflux system outer membrane protein